MQVLRLGGMQREPFVEALEESGQEPVAGVHVEDVLKPKFLHKAILEFSVSAGFEGARPIFCPYTNARTTCSVEPLLVSTPVPSAFGNGFLRWTRLAVQCRCRSADLFYLPSKGVLEGAETLLTVL
jgi:hypothetical protein